MVPPLAAVVDASCGALVRIPVELSGAWAPETALPDGWRRREWHGVARAAEPMVALLLAGAPGRVEWARSKRPRRPQPGREAGDAPENALDVWLAVTAGPGQALASWSARVHGAEIGRAGPVADGARALARAEQTPIAIGHASTGMAFELAAFEGAPVAFSLLLLAASQVEVARNGLWRVRRALTAALHEPMRTVLTRGRRGAIALDPPAPGP